LHFQRGTSKETLDQEIAATLSVASHQSSADAEDEHYLRLNAENQVYMDRAEAQRVISDGKDVRHLEAAVEAAKAAARACSQRGEEEGSTKMERAVAGAVATAENEVLRQRLGVGRKGEEEEQLKAEMEHAQAVVMASQRGIGAISSVSQKQQLIAAENKVLRRHAHAMGADVSAIVKEIDAAQSVAAEAAAELVMREEETVAANEVLRQQLQLRGTDMKELSAKVEAARREAAERVMQGLHDEAGLDADAFLEVAVVEAEHRVYREQVVQAAAQGQDMGELLAVVDATKSAVRSYNKRVKYQISAGATAAGSVSVTQTRRAEVELEFENKVLRKQLGAQKGKEDGTLKAQLERARSAALATFKQSGPAAGATARNQQLQPRQFSNLVKSELLEEALDLSSTAPAAANVEVHGKREALVAAENEVSGRIY
jgi:hypothetical protein